MIEDRLRTAKPEGLLRDDFLDRLRVAVKNAGQAAIANPFASAAGWTLAGMAACLTLLAAVGRLDLLPDIVSKLVRFVGGS